MCGFAGYYGRQGWIDEGHLLQMRDTLIHRGPDDAGIYMSRCAAPPDGANNQEMTVGLGHRRLSILDLSKAGKQPMCNEDGSVWIVYNGEFYNYADYREELEQKGHIFESATDTEVILHLYEEYGVQGVVERINGMYAFAIWDESRGGLVMARDIAGKKPLYYAECDGGVIFASEIKALRKSGVEIDYVHDKVSIGQYWMHGYCIGDRTCFRGVKKLRRGEIRWYGNREKVQEKKRTQGTEKEIDRVGQKRYKSGVQVVGATENEVLDEFENILTDAVRLRLISDVPVGLFLSGGIDSTLIAAIASRKLGVKLETFTVSFEGEQHDESGYARSIADYLGLPNKRLHIDERTVAMFMRIVCHFDEPLGDPSIIPTWYLCEKVKKYVTVALSGDGGDELFGGYDEYAEAYRIWGKGMHRNSVRDLLARMAGAAFWHCWTGRRILWSEWKRNAAQLGVNKHDYWRVLSDRKKAEKMEQGRKSKTATDILQIIDKNSYLIDDVLTKVDRCSMAHGLEVRSPFLDRQVVEFAEKLGQEWLFGPCGEQKYIMRCLLERYLPRHLWDRRKQGFTPPWETWFDVEAREFTSTVAARLGLLGLLNNSTVRKWQIFVYCAMNRNGVEGELKDRQDKCW